jgi:O-antigen/teichoic acid export membrane protein
MHWRRSAFLGHVVTAASGTALAQALTLAFTPLITRLYGPEAMGLLGVFTAVVGSLAALSALSYPLAIVLPAPAGEAVVLVRLSLLLGLLTALAAAAVLALWGPALLLALNAGEIAPWAMLIPVAMLVGVCSQVMSHWLARHQAFAFGARFAVLASLLANGLKAIFGWLQPVAAALILADWQAHWPALPWPGCAGGIGPARPRNPRPRHPRGQAGPGRWPSATATSRCCARRRTA